MATDDGDAPQTVLQNAEDIRFLDIFNDSDEEEFEGFHVDEIDIDQNVASLSQFAPDPDPLDELDRENGWTKSDNHQMPELNFEGASVLNAFININPTPIDFFNLFINDELIEKFVFQTNSYAEEKQRGSGPNENKYLEKWKEVTLGEMKVFLAGN